MLFTCPDEYTLDVNGGDGIVCFTVTHDRAQSKDYLVIIYTRNEGFGNAGKVEYSVDGGITWQAGPIITQGHRGGVYDCWYIDS